MRLTNRELADVIAHSAVRARNVRVKRYFAMNTARAAEWITALAVLIAGCAELHLAFGMLLCGFVTLRFVHHSRAARSGEGGDPRELMRRMSRTLYLILYGVLLMKLMTGLTSFSWHDAGLICSWSPRFQAAPKLTFIECGERFRIELLWGVIALCLIRVVAASRLPIKKSNLRQLPELEAQS